MKIRRLFRRIKKLFRLWSNPFTFRIASGRGSTFCHIDHPSETRLPRFFVGQLQVSGWAVDLGQHAAPRVRIRVSGQEHFPGRTNRQDVQRAFNYPDITPDCGFTQIVDLALGTHLLKIEVETPERTWLTVYRSIVVRLPAVLPQRSTSVSYRRWMRLTEQRLRAEQPELAVHCERMLVKPRFSVIVDARTTAGFEKTEPSIQNQIYRNWESHVLVDDARADGVRAGASAVDDLAAAAITGDFLVFVRAGDVLAPNALYEFASALNADAGLDLIYGDEGRVTFTGRHVEPFFKPDWSPDYLESFNYLGYPVCCRTSLARRCFERSRGHYDFVLRATELSQKIHHIRRILLERRADKRSRGPSEGIAEDIKALDGRLLRTGRRGIVKSGDGRSRYYEIGIALKHRPLVSIVIPTAGKTITFEGRTIDLVVNCISQITERSSYRNFEIIVIENNDLSPEKRDRLAKLGCKLVTYYEPAVNIPKKLNLGAAQAVGEFLILMNDDIELIGADWIERMLEQFEKSHVGVVGAKLLYPSGLLQHAGVVHNMGNPAHARRLYPRDDSGYFYSTCSTRNYMAVTGACMMTRSEVYRRVGGYTEELAISFNDVDYCLKVGELGLYTVYAPKAELIHLESQSRVPVLDVRELNWFHARWARATTRDPFYNERHLTAAPPTFVPHTNPRLL